MSMRSWKIWWRRGYCLGEPSEIARSVHIRQNAGIIYVEDLQLVVIGS